MAAPGSYDDVTITVTPKDLSDAATTVAGCVGNIVDSLNAIDDTISGLKLGWAGATATEATDFYNQWKAAMGQMFGTKDQPAQGVLNMIVFALKAAANNYNAADTAVVSMFSGFGQHLTPAGEGGDSTAPIPAGDTIADGAVSAVGESNWTSV